MQRFLTLLGISAAVMASASAGEAEREERVYNPYARPRNGPPLTRVFHKARFSWILAKLQNPKHHPAARMPDFKFTEDQALEIMAYLKAIAGPAPATEVQWPAWSSKDFEAMSDEESAAMFKTTDRGKAVWSNARCSICHSMNGPGGEIIGGFVDLRVGGIDLQISGDKLKRDWIYEWVKDPKGYFPDTLMPRFRLSDDETKALVEYLLRDDAFRTVADEEEESRKPANWKVLDEPGRAARGRRLIQLSRCVICHEVKGIRALLPQPGPRPPPARGTFEFLAYDMRCLSCHSLQGRGGTYAPDLTNAGSRLHSDWIAKFVESPDMIRPLSQQMPKLNMSADEAKIISAYMRKSRLDLKIPEAIPGGAVTSREIQLGRQACKTRGCFSCHALGEGPGGVVGPDLATVGDRLKSGYIWYHLKNPHAVNPYSPEPDYGLSDKEARALAAYLASKKK